MERPESQERLKNTQNVRYSRSVYHLEFRKKMQIPPEIRTRVQFLYELYWRHKAR